jgi:DNA (cytosine-5)-methyltransferase 1
MPPPPLAKEGVMDQLELFVPRSESEDGLPIRRKKAHAKGAGTSRGSKPLRVVELFAGVGGFRIGLEGHQLSEFGAPEAFRTVWANQWEPTRHTWGAYEVGKTQHAARVYQARFDDVAGWKHFNHDIRKVVDDHLDSIPDHDLLCGGFPCQDYSVAKPLKHAAGIVGRKGVLWWAIHDLIERKGKKAPDYLFLENVDRLLKSPVKQRGRDFAVMLASLANRGYAVEWRIVNAADYGRFQRRRRIFILAYKKGTALYEELRRHAAGAQTEWLVSSGVFAKALPVEVDQLKPKQKREFALESKKGHGSEQEQLHEISVHFNKERPTESPFENGGFMFDYKVFTQRLRPASKAPVGRLRDVVKRAQAELKKTKSEIPEEFWVDSSVVHDKKKGWAFHKGPKSLSRKGGATTYDEGGMNLTDPLDKPGRTIITSEGGSAPSRFKHLIDTAELDSNGGRKLSPSKRYRRLIPLELELMNDFPPNWTNVDERMSANRRAFFMGNALVVGVVAAVGKELAKRLGSKGR